MLQYFLNASIMPGHPNSFFDIISGVANLLQTKGHNEKDKPGPL